MNIKTLTAKERKKAIRALALHNMTFSNEWFELKIPDTTGKHPFRAIRNRNILIQIYSTEFDNIIRMSVNRTYCNADGDWLDGISWDHLMTFKRVAGYGDYDAVEVYPKDDDVVNVANIRHLFIFLKEEIAYKWKKS